jgi:subtilisin
VRKQRIPILTTSALSLIAICIIVIGIWDIFPGARSQTLAPQDQVSSAELSAAIEAQREASAKLTRNASFDQRLRKLSEKAQKRGTVSVIVRVRAPFRPEGQMSSAVEALAQRKVIEEAQDQMLSWLRYVPSTSKKTKYLPYVAASVDAAGLEQLQSSSETLDVSGDEPLRLTLSESLFRVGAPRAWAGNFKGTDRTIAVLDSGVDKNHTWLSGKVVSEACYSTNDDVEMYRSVCRDRALESTAPDSGVPCTDIPGVENCGHGTHVAGIAAGRGGVAYDAKVIAMQVMSYVTDPVACRGQESCMLAKPSDVVRALGRVYELRDTYRIAAVNLNLASGEFMDHCDTESAETMAMRDAINLLKSANIATVIASGNDSFTEAMSFPACISSAVSVGATRDGSGGETPVDALTHFSNSAPFLKLLAPGAVITSSVPGGFVGGSGTSMAAAHVAGAMALLRQELPAGTNSAVWFGDALPAGAVPYPDDTAAGGVTETWNWVSANPAPHAGTRSHQSSIATGIRQHFFTGATSTLQVATGEMLYAWAYLDSANMPSQIMLQWHDGVNWDHRAYWGANNIGWGQDGTPSGKYMGRLPQGGGWVKLVIPAYAVGLEGRTVSGMAFTQHRGRVTWGPTGKGSASVDDLLNLLSSTGAPVTDARLGANNRSVPRIRVDAALGVNVPDEDWVAEYYNNPNLADAPVLTQKEGAGFIDRSFDGTSPVAGVGPVNYSVRWTRKLILTNGTYRFSVTGDDGVRLYIDGVEPKVNEWRDQPPTSYNYDIPLDSGPHEIKLEYYQAGGPAQVRLIWRPYSSACDQGVSDRRWKGEYYNNANLTGFPVVVKDDSGNDSLNSPWAAGGCSQFIFPDYFSARWTRWVDFAHGDYRFTVSGDNGVRLWVDGHLAINRWTNTVGTDTAIVQIQPGLRKIVLEFFETFGGESVGLSWSRIPPNPPTSLSATAISTSQINLSWADGGGFKDGYRIERWNGGWSLINTVGATTLGYADTGLTPSTTYYYRVKAFNSGGESGYSNETNATTQGCSMWLSSYGVTFGPGGGWGRFDVLMPAGCFISWTATPSGPWPWVHITSGHSGVGSGSIEYYAEGFSELDASRSLNITIAGGPFNLHHNAYQYGPCNFTWCPSALSQPTALDQSATDAGPRGLTARYYGNTTLSGEPALQRVDPLVNFNWAGNRPDAALPADGFSARWSGRLAAPSSEAYTFYLHSDGGARLWVNDRLVIDRWRPTSEPETGSAPVKLKAGEKADVRVEYYNAGGKARVHLLWGSASTPKQIIPWRHLYPEDSTNVSTPADAKQQTGMLAPPGPDSDPKATRPQPGRWPGRAGLALLITCGVAALLLRRRLTLAVVALLTGAHMPRTSRGFRHFTIGYLATFFALALTISGSAQTIRHAENTVDSSLRSEFNVDPSTLNMRFSIKLGEFPGRGTNIPISFDYSSKVWEILFSSTYTFEFAFFTESFPSYAEKSISGWTFNMGVLGVPELDTRGNLAKYDIKGEPLGNTTHGVHISRIAFRMPDGSTRELRKSDIPATAEVPNVSGTYVAADDPRLKYDADNRVLYMPDGSRYTFNCCPDGVEYVQFIDRNGNVMNFNSRDGWTDTVGRRLLLSRREIGQESTLQHLTLPGPHGATRTYTLVWKTLDKVLSSGGGAADLHYVSDFSSHIGLPHSPALFHSQTPDQVQGGGRIFNPEVLSDVILPNEQRYSFTYNVYGEIDKIQLPTGGYHKYEYAVIPALDNRISIQVYGQANRGVVRHSVSESGNASDERTWNYSVTSGASNAPYIVTETRPDNTRIERHIHRENDAGSQNFGFNDVRTGRVYDERVYAAGNRLIRRTLTEWHRNVINYPPGIETTKFATRYPRPVRIVEILVDPTGSALAKTTTMNYDADLNVTARNCHDHVQIDPSFAQTAAIGSIPHGALLKTEESTYLVNDPDIDQSIRDGYRSRNLLSLPTKSIIKDGSGTVVSAVQNNYDESAYPLTTYPAVLSWADPQSPHRGNVTTTRTWSNNVSGSLSPWGDWNAGNWVTAHFWYDQTGNGVRSSDGKGNESTFSYSDNFDGVGPQNSFAYLTGSSNALGHAATSKYDYNTGVVIEAVEPNGTVTRKEFNDPFNRPTRSISANGTSLQSQRTVQYDDANRKVVASADLSAYGDNKLKSEVVYDGLGRAVESRTYENETDYVRSFTEYDVLGRPHRASTRHRPGDSIAWTETVYDALGRVIDVETPDGAHVITQYSGGNQVTVIDQAGKMRRTVTDALGRLTKVTEAPGVLDYHTFYSYDALGNLRQVTQGAQTRIFVYDSRSRLISATNPESGRVTYAYDPNGNLTEKTDARGVRMTITYDALNRVSSKSYAGLTDEGTAAANVTSTAQFFYDDYTVLPVGAPRWPGTPSKGRLIGVTYGNGSEGTYYKYDALGRIVINHQRQGTLNYATSYVYNRAGDVTREDRGNPARRRTEMLYDEAGRLLSMKTGAHSALGFVFSSLVSEISYTPFGRLQSETYGNGLIHSVGYNNRLQPTEMRLGRPDNLESVFTIYSIYGTAHNVNDQDAEITSTHNNGNIARIKYSVSGTVRYAQTFQYDPLNRLGYAVEHNNGVYNDAERAWYQSFAYDPHGNRGIKVENTSNNADAANMALQLADFSGVNNRIARAGYAYDSSGNLTEEPGKRFTYDGEGRIVTATVAGGLTSQYFYDGRGCRVRKVVGGVATRYEYGAGRELIAEWQDSAFVVIKDYFYKDGELLATKTGTNSGYEFATADHLGSPRAWTDQTGNLVAGGRHDYRPFGEELFAGVGMRTTGQGYATNTQQDGQRKQFTGKERDIETELSYFLARYSSSVQGRFNSPDPFNPLISGNDDAIAAYANQPQNWNRYSYALNQPLKYIDPDGENPLIAVGAIVGGVIGGASKYIELRVKGEPVTFGKIAGAVVGGAITGAVGGATLGASLLPATALAIGSVASVGGGIVERTIAGESAENIFGFEDMAGDAVGGVFGSVTFGAAGGLAKGAISKSFTLSNIAELGPAFVDDAFDTAFVATRNFIKPQVRSYLRQGLSAAPSQFAEQSYGKVTEYPSKAVISRGLRFWGPADMAPPPKRKKNPVMIDGNGNPIE